MNLANNNIKKKFTLTVITKQSNGILNKSLLNQVIKKTGINQYQFCVNDKEKDIIIQLKSYVDICFCSTSYANFDVIISKHITSSSVSDSSWSLPYAINSNKILNISKDDSSFQPGGYYINIVNNCVDKCIQNVCTDCFPCSNVVNTKYSLMVTNSITTAANNGLFYLSNCPNSTNYPNCPQCPNYQSYSPTNFPTVTNIGSNIDSQSSSNSVDSNIQTFSGGAIAGFVILSLVVITVVGYLAGRYFTYNLTNEVSCYDLFRYVIF